MKKIFLGVIIFLVSGFITAQQKVELVDVDQIIMQTEEYGEEEDFEKALEEISKVPQNDSSYYSSLITKSYYLLNTEQYEEALKVTEEGLKSDYHPVKYYFMMNNASAYTGLEDYETALEKYDEAIKKYPKNHKFYYNKAIILEKLDRLEEASKMYQTSITYNPLYANSHLKLAALCYTQHHITQAMMGLSMYLLINPDGSGSYDILEAFNNMVETKNDSKKQPGLELSVDDESFEEIDLIINNYAALNRKYKTGSKLDLPVIKQTHAMIKQLEDYEGEGGFYDKYYVPFFKFIDENDYFNDFANTIAFSVKNEKYKSMVNKKIPSIKSFITAYQTRWFEIIGDNEAVVDGEKKPVTYLYRNSKVDGYGVYKDNITIGKWQVFNNYGSVSSVGSFDKEGKKHGTWTWYNINGDIEEQGIYDHGMLNGEYFVYYDNGKLNVHANYKDDELDGNYEKYYENGALMKIIDYVDGKYEGEYLSYYSIGKDFSKYKIVYVNDEIDGMVYEYYPDGILKYEILFKNGNREGVEISYFENGKIDTKKNYVNDELEGEYIEYHSNGALYQTGTCSEGYYVGEWKTYYTNGVVEKELNYTKGKIDGLMKKFDRDGELFYEYNYRKGEIIAYKFYNKNHEVIKEAKKQKGEFFYEGYSSNGNITSEGLYDISGGKKGEWKFYTDNNVLKTIEFNEENNLQGTVTRYYPNGEVSSLTSYVDDTIDGYYSTFYPDKQLKEQGWYSKDKLVGNWMSYYPDGTIKTKNYYTNGKLYGMSEIYAVDGKIQSKLFYQDGEIITEYYFDSDGNLIEEINIDIDSSSYTLINRYVNGNVSNMYNMLYGIKNGKHNQYYFNGTLRAEGSYLDGEPVGEWKWYYESGELETVGSYLEGRRNGVWIDYHENGKVEKESNYIMGYFDGTKNYYNENGILTQTMEYETGDLHGEFAFYSENGNLQLIRYYFYDRLIGYSYLDSDSKILPMIPIENETAKIVSYFDNGKVSREMEFIAGEFTNGYNEYYYSGQLFEEQTFLDDEKDGVLKTYYPDGTLKEEINYKRGFLSGDINKYHSNGKLKEHYTMLNDATHGKRSKYDDSGKLIEEKIYFDGEVFSEKKY